MSEPLDHDDPSLEALRMPPALRGAYLLALLSPVPFVAMCVGTVFVGLMNPIVLVFPLLGVALACGGVVAGAQSLSVDDGRHRPLAAAAMVLCGLEVLGWLAVFSLPLVFII